MTQGLTGHMAGQPLNFQGRSSRSLAGLVLDLTGEGSALALCSERIPGGGPAGGPAGPLFAGSPFFGPKKWYDIGRLSGH